MSVIQSIETQLIARLKRCLPSEFYVAGFPGNPEAFDPAKMRAAALVHYSGARYGEGNGMDLARQSRELRFTIVLYLGDLNGGAAAYPILDTMRQWLQNTALEGATPLKMMSERLTDQAAGQWEWQVDVSCVVASVAAEQSPARPRIPLTRFQEEG